MADESAEQVPLFMVAEEAGGMGFLSMKPDRYLPCRPATEEDITADAMAQMLDQDAENNNDHQFVGVHAALVMILEDKIGIVKITEIMRELVNRGGLHRLSER